MNVKPNELQILIWFERLFPPHKFLHALLHEKNSMEDAELKNKKLIFYRNFHLKVQKIQSVVDFWYLKG